MTILEKINFEEYWLSEVDLTKENIKIAFTGIRATALEQQPCEDCISREAVKEMIIKEWTNYVPMELDINLSFVLEKISEMPSVTSSYNSVKSELDCISREDVISLANKGYLVSNSNYKSVCDVINALPSVTPKVEWIPCSERLPERDVNVLAYHRNISFDYQYVSWIDDNSGRWCGFIGNLSDDVIAWMPLPTPYVPDTNVGEMGESEDK